MKSYEYKTVEIKFTGFFKKKTSKVDDILNAEAANGWRFKQMILPASGFGESSEMVAIFERELNAISG